MNNLLTGNADQIRAFLTKLDTPTAGLNKQRDDIAGPSRSTNNLFAYVASRNNTLDRLLVDLPRWQSYLANSRDRLADAVGPWAGSTRSPVTRWPPPRPICAPTSTSCSAR